MDHDHNQQPNVYPQSHMRASGQHQYPHSHHGTPAAEYTGFVWSPSHSTDNTAMFGHSPPQRSNHPPLHSLVMPQWPSMLSSQSSHAASAYYPTAVAQSQMGSVSSPPLMTPVSASSTRSGSTPRRTLTDEERRQMCEYHELNPTAKQNEIGLKFGVERSTVSKVLRQRDKYLQKHIDTVQSPVRKVKGKPPDIEKTLSNWVIKEQKKGVVVSDKLIKDKAQYFSSVSGADSAGPNPANDPMWLKTFKRRNNISGRKSSKKLDSSTPLKDGPSLQTREESSSLSPKDEPSPLHNKLRRMHSDESFDIESPDGLYDLTTTMSGGSISAALTEPSITSFSPNTLLSPTSPCFAPDSIHVPRSSLFRSTEVAFSSPPEDVQSPHGQIMPLIFHDLQSSSSRGEEADCISSNIFETSMDDVSQHLDGIDDIMVDSSTADIQVDMMQPQMNAGHAMQPPPLPSSLKAARTDSLTGPNVFEAAALMASPTHKRDIPPSQEEAREALQIVFDYFIQQPREADEMLSMEETFMLGRFMERLKERKKD